MDEAWERAVETALEGQMDASAAPTTLTLDGVVKCLHGRLPPPSLLERFQSLEHLSIANIGLSSLEKFPRLRNLQRLILSDNRISGGLESLVEAGLGSLRDLDLSNNRIQFLEDLEPLARSKLVSLDLYECPVTRIHDYRSKVFGMIGSLKYLDKVDADGNERPESDEEEEEEDEEEEEEDPGNGEVDGEERASKAVANGAGSSRGNGPVIEVDEDEESDAEEEGDAGETAEANGYDHRLSNGFRVAAVGERTVENEDGEEEEYVEDDEDDLGEETDEDDAGEEENGVEIHEIEDSDEEDGVEEDEDEEYADDEDVGEEENGVEVHEIEDSDEEDGVEEDDDDEDVEECREPSSSGRLANAEGEIDGHDQGEEDENGEIGEENGHDVVEDREYDVEDEEDFESSEYLVQPIRQAATVEAVVNDVDAGNDDEESEEEVDDEESKPPVCQHPSSSRNDKRRRDNDVDENDGLDDDTVEDSRSSKRR